MSIWYRPRRNIGYLKYLLVEPPLVSLCIATDLLAKCVWSYKTISCIYVPLTWSREKYIILIFQGGISICAWVLLVTSVMMSLITQRSSYIERGRIRILRYLAIRSICNHCQQIGFAAKMPCQLWECHYLLLLC